MSNFQAANPGAILEDFIRWHSPRDWIEEDEVDEYGQKKGTNNFLLNSCCEI
jgi:Rab3 GTPase-activating protein catalytic subunit